MYFTENQLRCPIPSLEIYGCDYDLCTATNRIKWLTRTPEFDGGLTFLFGNQILLKSVSLPLSPGSHPSTLLAAVAISSWWLQLNREMISLPHPSLPLSTKKITLFGTLYWRIVEEVFRSSKKRITNRESDYNPGHGNRRKGKKRPAILDLTII